MSLTSCAAANPLDKADKAAIFKATRTFTSEGIAADIAAMRAVDELIAQLRGEKSKLEGESVLASAKPTGVLAALENKSPEGTPYIFKKMGDLFKQNAGKEGSGSQRPLAQVKDFLSGLTLDTARDYLKIPTLSATQKQQIKLFVDTAASWHKIITTNLPKRGNAGYAYTDVIQHLILGDETMPVDIDDNIKTAISHGVFSYLAENGGKSRFKTAKEINNELGRDEDASLDAYSMNRLSEVGTRQTVFENSVGQKIVQSLGITALKNTPVSELPKLESALGAHALKLLVDLGILEQTYISGQDMAFITGKEDTDSASVFKYVRLARDGQKIHPTAFKIFQGHKGTDNVLAKLFGVEPLSKSPSLVAPPFVQKNIKNTTQGVPRTMAEVQELENAQANFLNMDMLEIIDQVGLDIFMEMAGAEHIEDKHPINVKGIVAKNDGLRREIENLQEFVSTIVDKTAAFFFDHKVYKTQRAGIDGNLVNPQASKIHRHSTYRAEWEANIDTTNVEQMLNFYLRVGDGLGIKTGSQSNAASLSADHVGSVMVLLTEDVIKDAVNVLVKMQQGEQLSSADKQTLLLGVQRGGEDMHSLASLLALAKYQFALSNGHASFKTQLMGEVDGVANGPMLSYLMLGAATTPEALFALLNKGGFFEEGSRFQNFNIWNEEPGNNDLYETTTAHMLVAARKLMQTGVITAKGKVTMPPDKVKSVMAAIWNFTGELEKNGNITPKGRKALKKPTTSLVFGSSLYSASTGMADAVIASIYDAIQDLKTTNGDPAQLIAHINVLLSNGGFLRNEEWVNVPLLSQRMSITNLMEYSFGKDEIKSLQMAFNKTMGKALRDTLATDFAVFIERSSAVNNAAQVSHEMFKAAYEGMREQLIEHLMVAEEKEPGTGIAYTVRKRKIWNEKTNKIEASGPEYKDPIHDLTPAQLKELDRRVQKVLPLMHTKMSKDSKDIRTGLRIGKLERGLSTKSTYETVTKFGRPFDVDRVVHGDTSLHSIRTSSTKTHGSESVLESPGVSTMVISAHSADSATMHYALLKAYQEALAKGRAFSALNLNDAQGTGVDGHTQAAAGLNSSLWDVMLDYSPATEMHLTFVRTLHGLADLLRSGDVPPAVAKKLLTALTEKADKMGKSNPVAVLRNTLITSKETSFKADDMKYQTMALAGVFDQYAFEGGQHMVTQEQREAAAAKRKTLTKEIDPRDLEALEVIENLLEKEEVSLSVGRNQTVNANDENDFEGYDLSGLKETKTSPFGTVGKPTATSDPELVAFFNDTPKATAKQVIDHLYRKLSAKDSGGNRDFNLKLLKMLSKTVNPSLTINLVTKDTSEDDVLGIPQSPAFGWYSARTTEEAIYLVNDDFTHSNIRVEVLLHEMTHAATMYRLTTTAGKPYRAELEQLLVATQKHLAATGVTKYAAALTSVDELVAYGMTSKDFQQNVLAKVQMTSKQGLLSSALAQFVDVLTRLLGFKDATAANGLGVLLSNVTALMEQGATERTEMDSRTLSMASPTDSYTTLDLHDALDNNGVTPAFDEHLKGLLGNIVESLHGPFGAFKESFMSKQAGTALEVWAKAQATGIAPFASQALLSGFPASQQEAFAMEQVEATVSAALSSRDASTKAAYKELYELYSEAYKTLKPSDFASQADYDFVFKIEQGNGGVSNYLSRFAALGLANQKFNDMLKISSSTADRVVKTSGSFAERLQLAFQKILAMFNRKVLHIYAGQPMDEKLGYLVEQLVDIEAKRKATLGDITWDVQMMNPMAKTAHQLTEAAKAGIAKAGSSAFIQGSKLQAVKAVGNLATILTTKGRTKSFLLAFRGMQDKYSDERMGVFSSLMQEYIGQDDKLQTLLRASKNNDGHRKTAISGFGKSAKEGFKDNGKAMTEASRNSITPVFLRTGAHHLVDHFSLVEIEAMLQSPAALQAAIAKIESQLASLPISLRADYIEKANALGMFKATGRNLDPHLLKNAHTIAKMYGTASQAKITDQQAEQAQPVIAALVALYALEYSNPEQLKHAHAALQTENQRTDGENGIEFVLALHKAMEKESLQRLFKGNPALMTHGYTPEIYDPFVTVTTANAVDGAKLVAQGYVKGAALSVDPADPDTSQRSLYVLHGLGMTRRLTGAVSFEGKAAKGSSIHSGYTNTRTTSGTNNANTNASIAANRAKLGSRLANRSRVDLSKAKDTSYMAPVLDEQGNVTTWTYLMQETTKDSLLRRDNRFDKVIGTLAGSILGKESGVAQNEKAVAALKEQYDADKTKNMDSYVLVGPKTLDKERLEIWNLLPYETKQTILKVWGEDGMLVRRDSMDIMFGYRKLSLTDAFDKDPVLRDAFDRVLVAIARAVFGEKAALRMAQGERAWQDIVAEAKDIIVVKSGVVMLSNIKSNMWLLAMSGVPIKDILYHHLVALKGSHTYQKDSEALEQLKRLQATSYTQGKDAQIARDIARLQDALARNPIKELMDAGLMPTIVEDVNPDDDIYSYKSGLTRLVDDKLKKVSPLVINAAKGIYMAHDTRLYQGVHRITQLSDFVARYTMYQHLTNQKVKPLTKEEAIQEASDAFINYDIPMHRSMQYLDDMGLMMFTKYFLRIQKVLVKNLRDNPGRVIGSILLANYLNLGETIHQEASMWGRIGNNPFGIGAGKYFSSLDDLATISGPMALIK